MRRWCILTLAIVAVGCDDDTNSEALGGADAQTAPDATPADAEASPDIRMDPACDDTRPPLVMAHGLLASGDTWGPHVQRFSSNNHCADRYHAFDWNTLNMQADHVADLDGFIDAVLAEHGVDQVDLMGHSAGGGLGYQYLADPARAAKVAHYVHVGSGVSEGPAGPEDAPVDTLNIWSPQDTIVEGGDIPGASNAELPGLDHYAVATAPEAFAALYAFLYDARPMTTEVFPDPGPIMLSGRAVVLGENTAEEGATVEVWPVDPATGQGSGDPLATFMIGEDGDWGPFEVAPDTPYVFKVTSTRANAPVVRYYREPFQRSQPLVYLRTLPTPPTLAGNLLRSVPFDDAHTVLVIFSASRAVLAGVDSLTVDDEQMATEAIASADDTLIALFLYDQGTDQADGDPINTFAAFPFLNALDRYFAADAESSLQLRFNDRSLAVPRWPSASDGAVIAVFD